MITLLSYELKKEKKTILSLSAAIIFSFAFMYCVMTLAPGLVIKIIMFINKTPWLLSFIGAKDYIKSMTFHQGALVVMTVVNILFMYKLLMYAVNSFMNDRRTGMILYFYSLSVSKTTYWFSKVISTFIYYITGILLLGLCVTLMSLSGIPVQILRDITLTAVFTRMLSVASTGFMMLSVGILLSTILSRTISSFIQSIYIIMLFLCVLPNILKTLPGIYNIACFIRNLVPIYWCNPWNVYSKTTCITSVLIGLICLLIGGIIFKKKSVY
ncbi:MAG: hypothetical protein ACI4D4_00585 [Lachnospira sp.]